MGNQEILYRYGADLDVVGKKGRTVKNVVEKHNNTELSEWLNSLNK